MLTYLIISLKQMINIISFLHHVKCRQVIAAYKPDHQNNCSYSVGPVTYARQVSIGDKWKLHIRAKSKRDCNITRNI